MRIKEKVVKLLSDFGIDYSSTISFLKEECKIDKGFEAQRVGLRVPSATTTGLITYTLATLNELSDQEEISLKEEILSFKIRGAFDDSAFGTQLYTCVWATSQCLLGLLSLRNITQQDVQEPTGWLCKTQSRSGGWSFSGREEDRIIYAPYSVLALGRYYDKFRELTVLEHLERTHSYAERVKPDNNIDKLIQEWLIEYTGKILGLERSSKKKQKHAKVDFAELIQADFANYVIFEHSIYPFSMQFYTPALYLFTRKFMSPGHPFNLYLVKYLLTHQIERKCWSHVTSVDRNIPYSFCTALSILTLYFWAYDIVINNIPFLKFPSSEKLKQQIQVCSYRPPKIFINYSNTNKEMATKVANGLARRGCSIWLANMEIKVGDSIIDKIFKGVAESDFLIILLSKSSVRSKWVKEELNAAKMREIAKRKVFVLPVLLEDCEIPPSISDKRYIDFRKSSLREGMGEIMKKVLEVTR